jgi:prepilin-type N-terminal cleavage/methylation domain-containing protein
MRRPSTSLRTGSTKGFSLIELMVVIFLLSLGLCAVAGLFVAGTISSSKARRMNTARQAAQRQLERLRSAGFAGCIVDSDIFTSAEGYTIIQQNSDKTGTIGFAVPNLPLGATGTIDIAYYSGATGSYPNLKDITVTATWPGGGVTAGNVVLHTYVANRP